MDGIGWAASAMAAARRRLEIATQNLANSSSDGFRRADAHGFLTAAGVRVETVTDQRQGALRRTGRSDDRAIVGPGYFVVRDARGSLAQTRAGAFVRGRDGLYYDDAGRRLIGTHLAAGSSVRRGFLESSNVNSIGEIIDVLAAQRSFETAQQTISAIDRTRQKADNDVPRLK